MIYENAVPISSARHADWYLEAVTDYAFCRHVNSIPLMAAEFASAALEYAIVFGGGGDLVVPVAVLGVRTDENLYVTEQGRWDAKYIPAFVRRYPFVFSSGDEGKTFTLCIDETFPGFNQSGRGERLFSDGGKPTPYLESVLKFLQQYQFEFDRTQRFCKKLKDLNVVEPMQAQINPASGERMSLSGFSAVQRGRLKTLSSAVLADLLNSDELELIFTHLVSMRNFETVKDRLATGKAQTGHKDQRRSDGGNKGMQER
jgi:hypothetical protein